MILIYLIMFMLSIDNIYTVNLTNNSLLNRSIIISSCQTDRNKLKPMPIPNNRQYYFYFSSQSSSSLSSSSSFSPLLHLSYCEHQQTTSYSSSGFSILYSSLRFSLTDIEDKKHSSSFHHHHDNNNNNNNTVLSAIDQSSSSTSTNIIRLMSSSTENPIVSQNMLTIPFSNLTLSNTSLSIITTQKGNQIFNIILLIGCIITGILILVIIYLIIKYYNRDEGTYKIDETSHFSTKSPPNNFDTKGCTGIISSTTHHRQKLLIKNDEKIDDSKEWYV